MMITITEKEVRIKYYEKFLFLSDTKIEILQNKKVIITGDKLYIQYYTDIEIGIFGKVESVTFI